MFVEVARRIWGGSVVEGGEPPVLEAPRRRPKIGLALGAGVARGWAGIGVVRALKAAGIEPDVVSGTSMGAVVGGCMLAGKLDELEAFARDLTPRKVLSLIDIRFGGSGLVGGDRLGKLLGQHLGETAIETLEKPFVAVATELSTGHEIWLSRGGLVEALRASYALPGVFEPCRLGRRLLVDGALVNPVPVSVCQALGADLIIAANFAHDGHRHATVVQASHLHDLEADEPAGSPVERAGRRFVGRLFGSTPERPGITGVMMESFNIIQERIMRSRLAGDPPDVMIAPKLGSIGLVDFHRAAEAIEIGREAAERAVPEIVHMMSALAR